MPSDATDEPGVQQVDLSALTADVGEWAEENFGDRDDIMDSVASRHIVTPNDPGSDIGAIFCTLGVNEEAGELTHSVLKRAQGIREDEDGVGPDAEMDAVGDIVIYLADFCHRRGYDLEECVRRAWHDEVRDRQWDSATAGGETDD